jgi:hypothetical protein
MYIIGVLLFIRGAFISHQLAAAKLQNAGLAVDRFTRDI